MKKSIGFYIFIVLCCCLVGISVWAFMASDTSEFQDDLLKQTEGYIHTQSVPTDNDRTAKQPEPAKATLEIAEQTTNELFQNSLEDGFIPTQETGELGSNNGAIHTKYPLNYKPSKYERLADSPLLIFTDDMIWQGSDGIFYAKKAAMADQAYHYQESAIALSVAPKYEKGQLAGCRLVEIPDGTLFAKLGLVSGDAILSINGTKPDMEPMALAFVNMVAGKQGKTTIEVEHRGKKRQIEIRAAE